MKISTKLKNVSFTGSNFDSWFGDMEFKEADKKYQPLTSKKLPRYMTGQEILDELKPEEVSLSDVWETIQTMSHDTWALFFVRDNTSVLRLVCVVWGGGGWDVSAGETSNAYGWRGDDQVFSRKFGNLDTLNQTLSHSETLTLESAIKICKENGLTVTKIY